jgi:2'-5' RNA ligase
LKEAGFTGTQTPGLPFHISMAMFPLDKEMDAIELMRKAAAGFSWVPVHISHIGMFAGGKVLFGAPEMNTKLAALHDALEMDTNHKNPWTPHVTVLIDEPETVYAALSVFVESFYPFVGKITRLHLCAFWPKREIATVELTGYR